MASIEKILSELNLPKQILDKGGAVASKLFGPSLNELGGLIADNIRLRRYKNQVKIFFKAQQILENNNLDPKKASLKVLAPLIELSSYEEEPNLQNKWAQLTVHVLTSNDEDLIFQQNCISILNRLSTEDALLLDKLYERLCQRRVQMFERQIKVYQPAFVGPGSIAMPENPEGYALDNFPFSIKGASRLLEIHINALEFRISNLVALGLLKWQTDVQVSAEKVSGNPENKDIDVNVEVYNNDDFIFTSLGDKFIDVCKSD